MKKLVWLLLLAATSIWAQQYRGQQITQFLAVSTGNTINLTQAGVNWHNIIWTTSGTVSTCSVRVDSSADGVVWNAGDVISTQTCTSNGNSTYVNFVASYIRVNMVTLTGGGSVYVTWTGYGANPQSSGGSVTQIVFSSPLTGGTITTSGTVGLGTVPVNAGGTNATTAATAASNLGARFVLCKQTSYVTNTGDTNAHVVGSCDIPKGTMGINSVVMVKLWGVACTGNGAPAALTGCTTANTGTCSVKVAWNTSAANSGTALVNNSISALLKWTVEESIANTGAANTQLLTGYLGTNAFALMIPLTAAIDTSSGSGTDSFVVFALTNSVSGDICGESWTVELIP